MTRLDSVLRVALLGALVLIAAPPSPAADGVITGRVVDASEQPVSGAVVIVCDQQTGIPIHAPTGKPFTTVVIGRGQDGDPMDLLRAITDTTGRFVIEGVADGEYRLIVQSWADASGPIAGVLETNGRIVELRGIADHVRVPLTEMKPLEIRPIGTASLHIDLDMPNDETLLIVSAAPLATDPILGFTAWSGPFIPSMLAGNRMPSGETTVRGLPAGELHVGMFAADNNPGFGGATTRLKAGELARVDVPIIASWSNGHHDPPPRLVPLVERLKGPGGTIDRSIVAEQLPEFHKLMKEQPSGPAQMWAAPIPFLDSELTLADGAIIPLKDWLAARAYIQLRKQVERHAAQRRQQRLAEMGVDESVTYEEAFTDLYTMLGERYPSFALKGIDWPAVGEELLPRAGEVDSDEAFGLLCMELVSRLEDSHAHLLDGAVKVPRVDYPRWNPGLACLVDDRGKPVVYFIDEGGPAQKAGVKIGMTVLEINGTTAEQAIAETMRQIGRYAGYSSQRYLRYHAFRWFVRQAQHNAPVRLTVEDVDGVQSSFLLPAAVGVRYIPRLPVPIEGIGDSTSVSWAMLADDIGYIYVRRIRGDLIERLDAAVGELRGARGLIIDVRGNSGGGFDYDRSHLNFALDRDDQEQDRPRFRGPIAVLIDARCISAGEGWASWFVASGRGRFFGEATAGASGRKETHTLSNGLFKVRFPVKAYKGYLDRPIERRGLEPDVEMMPRAADLAARRDTVLEAAKQYLIEQAR